MIRWIIEFVAGFGHFYSNVKAERVFKFLLKGTCSGIEFVLSSTSSRFRLCNRL